MSQRARSRARGFLSRGALLSLLVHAHLLAPIGIIMFLVGLVWAAIEFWVDRVTDTDTPAKRDAERKEIG